MASNNEPKTMRAWLYSSVAGGLEKNLKLSEATVKPLTKGQVLVKVHSTSLNPVDYKVGPGSSHSKPSISGVLQKTQSSSFQALTFVFKGT